MAKLLLDAGADPDVVTKDGVGPMFFAIKTQNREAIQMLLEYGCDIVLKSLKKLDRSPIFTAIIDNNRSFYELAYKGQPDKLKEHMEVKNSQGLNMVCLAAYLKRWKFLTHFAKQLKGKIDYEDPEGLSPFM